MIRKIIEIDEEKCNGCGACATACHEEAIVMVNGKAKLLRDDFCDGLGACLPSCPTGAISFIEREAEAFDEAAVIANKQKKEAEKKEAQRPGSSLACGCPGSQSRQIKREPGADEAAGSPSKQSRSMLSQWPVQIKLVPVNAPYFNGANLLIAADCSAFAYGNFHNDFIRNRVAIIGCPKLDAVDYSEKLSAIIKHNNIKSVTVVRMEVPCCGGIEHAAIHALKESGKFIPWQVVTISTDGRILD